MDVDELVEVVEDLPDEVEKAVIDSLDEEEWQRFQSLFNYAEDTAAAASADLQPHS